MSLGCFAVKLAGFGLFRGKGCRLHFMADSSNLPCRHRIGGGLLGELRFFFRLSSHSVGFSKSQLGRVVSRLSCRLGIRRRFLGELRFFVRFSKLQPSGVVGRFPCRLSISRGFLGELRFFFSFGKFQPFGVAGYFLGCARLRF